MSAESSGRSVFGSLHRALALLFVLILPACVADRPPTYASMVLLDLPCRGLTSVPVERLGRAISPQGPREVLRLDVGACRALGIAGFYRGMAGAPVMDAQGNLRSIVEDGMSLGLPCIVSIAPEREFEAARNRCLFLAGETIPDAQQRPRHWPLGADGSVAAPGKVLLLKRWVDGSSSSADASATVCWSDESMAVARLQDRPGTQQAGYGVALSRALAFVDEGDRFKLVFEAGPVVGRTACIVGNYALLLPEVPASVRMRVTLCAPRSFEQSMAITVYVCGSDWPEACRAALKQALERLDLRRPGSVEATFEVAQDTTKTVECEAVQSQAISTRVGTELVECLRARTTGLVPGEIRVTVRLGSD